MGSTMSERPWRVGLRHKIHIYEESEEGERGIPVATAMTEEYAEQIVRDHNARIGGQLVDESEFRNDAKGSKP